MPLLSEPHLRRALRQAGRRSSSPGVDRMSWADLRRRSAVLLPELAKELAEGTWRPDAVRPATFATYTGKPFVVVVPTVRDRLVFRALRNAVEPVLEARAFADWTSGYRPGRNRITALRQAMAHQQTGHRWVADVDVASASEGASVDEAVDWFATYVHDGSFLALLRTALAGLPTTLAAGSALAPLMINLRLSQVDELVGHLRVVRLADNYCAFATDETEAEAAFAALVAALGRWGLAANGHKSQVRRPANVEDLFLTGG